jgi:allophanate hydrolase
MSDLASLRAELLSGQRTVEEVVAEAYQRLRALDPATVIAFVPEELTRDRARQLATADPAGLPLYGIPFAVKDNIDVAGVATTAGCPAYGSTPTRSATVVRRLEAAGAIPVAKTNLDQFATGLVGTRSPYGTPRNPWDAERVPGGSSSGSAVAVATGAVPFALGTDTAGSGRVPAAFTGIVGAKPTRGWLSTAGVIPAVRTLDCVSVFALSVADAWAILEIAGGYDPDDVFSRMAPSVLGTGPVISGAGLADGLRIGVGRGIDLDLDTAVLAETPGITDAAPASAAPATRVVEVDLEPFLEAGRLLYGGPWVSERVAAVGAFIAAHRDEVDPTVGSIITAGGDWSAADAARATYALARLRRLVDRIWQDVDAIVVPTAPPAPTLEAVAADPIGVNTVLGTFTSFANLLDLCGVAVPTGVVDGFPTGVQVLAPPWADATAAAVADRIHRLTGGLQGTTDTTRCGPPWSSPRAATVDVAVAGAHLRGQPLHHQLTDLGARWVMDTSTSPTYLLYALDTTPAKPGLVRSPDGDGAAIKVEVYRLSFEAFGRLVALVPAPMCIGTLELDSGPVPGFLCEPAAIEGAKDITSFGGWAAYRASM